MNNEVSEINKYNIICSRSKKGMPLNMPSAHYHKHYELYYLLSGKRKYFIDNKIFNLNKGDLVLIPKGILHKTTSADNGSHERLLISFNDTMLYPDFDKEIQCCFNRYFYNIPKTMTGTVEMMLLKIEKEFKTNDIFSEKIIKGLLLELFAYLIRSRDKLSFEHSQSKSDSRILEVAEFINKNYEKDISLNDAAVFCFISPEHLSRKFKKVTGFGFNEYLTLVRIMHAEKLLASENSTITEIALKCGFNDSNYFSSVFKKFKGISPKKYIKYNKIY